MLFNSFHFMVFFPVVVVLYFLISEKHRWKVLLVSSYYFYMAWQPTYLLLILSSTVVDYWAGARIAATNINARKKRYLLLSLLVNLGLLFSFKYFNFFNETIRAIFDLAGLEYTIGESSLLLPVGISFYTFQTLSYTIDIYYGRIKPERHLGKFALFVSFFPQLVAGPIERAANLLPQFRRKVSFDYQRVTNGMKLMAWGLFKKVVIADRLAILVNQVYNDPTSYQGPGIAVATVLFAYQIYCDFSGYSDIAIGAAQVLGFDLMENFRRPYHAKSIGEFWHRWHISLSTWFRDYVYIPLGGSRVSIPRWYVNLMVVFVVSGLWHGANWTFMLWGALHGFYMIFSAVTARSREKFNHCTGISAKPVLHSAIQIVITFVLVNISWIFFRASSISVAVDMIYGLFTGWSDLFAVDQVFPTISLGLPNTFLIGVGSILFLEGVQVVESRKNIRNMLADKPVWFRWAVYYIMLLGLVLGGVYDQTPFIYFQF